MYSCCKEQESFNYTQIDNNGKVIGGDTTQGTLTQDAKLNDWATDSVSSSPRQVFPPDDYLNSKLTLILA